jgi:hypothetical protein
MPLTCRYGKTIPANVLHGWAIDGAWTGSAGKWRRQAQPSFPLAYARLSA